MKQILPVFFIILFILSCSESENSLVTPVETRELKEGCYESWRDEGTCISNLIELDEKINEIIFLKCENKIEKTNETHIVFGPSIIWESLLREGSSSDEILEQQSIMQLLTPRYIQLSLYKDEFIRNDNPQMGERVGELSIFTPMISIPKEYLGADAPKTGKIMNIPVIEEDLFLSELRCSLPNCKKYISRDGDTEVSIDREDLTYLYNREYSYQDYHGYHTRNDQEKMECKLIDNNVLEKDFISSFDDLFNQFDKNYDHVKKQVEGEELERKKRKKEIEEKSKI